MRIGFLSDIHEDISSLDAAFTMLDREGAEAVVCLGDIVGFTLPFQKNIHTRDAVACIEMIRERCSVVVAGNHDLYAVRRIPEHRAGIAYPENWYELSYEKREKVAKGRVWMYEDSELPVRLTDEAAAFLRSLPEQAMFEVDGSRIFLSHFHFPDPSGSTIALPRGPKHLAEHFRVMADAGCTRAFSGHGHPEGSVVATPRTFGFRPFGQYPLESGAHWIVCPCVANTSRKNGLLLYDTRALMVSAIPLGSRKKYI